MSRKKFAPFDETIKQLTEQGLLDEERNLTPAGHEYVRDLIARCKAHDRADSYLRK